MSDTDATVETVETASEPTEKPDIDSPRLRAAEAILAARYGGSPQLATEDILRENYRNRVLRCTVQDAPAGAPSSVIIKTVEGEGESAYAPENDTHSGSAWRFYNEWAGNQFLDTLVLDPPPGAGFIGGDRTEGMIVLHDLGKEDKSLADWMQQESRTELEAALISYAASLGRLHAATVGKEAEFMAMRREIGGTEIMRAGDGTRWRGDVVEPFRSLCAAVGIALPAQFEAEIDLIEATIDAPAPFRAFSPGDACPDNHRLTDSGYVRFFDFEFAGFTHALLAAAYFYMPFPTCWCVNRLPDEMVARMETTYRGELVQGCPEAADDAIFYPTLLAACAFWTVTTLGWGWEKMLTEDSNWGISTLHQRHLLRLGNFLTLAERHDTFPALRTVCLQLRDSLRERFALPEEMPLYLPFRESASPAA